MNKDKKPIYKKWWFWVFVVPVTGFIILMIVALIAISGMPIIEEIQNPTNQNPVSIEIKSAYRDSEVELFLNNEKIQSLQSDSSGNVQFENITLKEGNNTFKAKATNGKGKSKESTEYVVVYDITPPDLLLDSLEPITNNQLLDISGKSEENSTVKLMRGDTELKSVDMEGESFNFRQVSLEQGENKFTVFSIDKAGNKSEKKELIITHEFLEEKEAYEKVPIEFETEEKNDNSLAIGETKVEQEGSNGEKEITYLVKYKNGEEISREIKEEKVLTKPKNKIILVGTYVAPIPTPEPTYTPTESPTAEESNNDSAGTYDCSNVPYCKDMSSCDEAYYYLNNCGASSLDRDKDGIPCENVCQ